MANFKYFYVIKEICELTSLVFANMCHAGQQGWVALKKICLLCKVAIKCNKMQMNSSVDCHYFEAF